VRKINRIIILVIKGSDDAGKHCGQNRKDTKIMSNKENSTETKVQATNNSSAVGKFEVGGSVGRDVVIGGTHIHNTYATPESVKSPDAIQTIETKYFEPETILIPAGTFWMGSDPGEEISSHETPRHEVFLKAYRIGKYPITNSQFEEYIRETKKPVNSALGWDGRKVQEGLETLPVSGVTWYEAISYCEWLSAKTNRRYSLPNEAQWEKACRGGKNNRYPWGDDFDLARCNHGNVTLAAVDAYPPQNEYGCFDLVGNIMQWTSTLWGKKLFPPDPHYRYPWKEDGRNSISGNPETRHVMRGGSMAQDIKFNRCSHHSGQLPSDRGVRTARHGFRVAINLD
jgi:formylglycine-generating enzyme required for sulfatase activity